MKEKSTQLRPWMLVVAIIAAAMLLISTAVVIWWGAAGVESFDEGMTLIGDVFKPRENDVYYKKTYSVSNKKLEKKQDKVVATIGDKTLTNRDLQVYYWTEVYDFLQDNGYQAVYLGLDYAQPLDEQSCPLGDGTWQQYFLQRALNTWHTNQAMALLAEKNGLVLDEQYQDDLANMRGNLTQAAISAGFTSIDAMLQKDFGSIATYDIYYRYIALRYSASGYFAEKYNAFDVSDGELEAYFARNEEELKADGITKDSGDVADVRHILIPVTGGKEDVGGNMVYSDEEWEACRKEAQKLLDEWLAGDATEDQFAELAKKHSQDEGSRDNGGLYRSITEKSGFVKEFLDWTLDESREVGNYGLIRTEYGYHIMYFVGNEAQWLRESREGLRSELSEEVWSGAREQFSMEVTYKDIVLAEVDLSAQ